MLENCIVINGNIDEEKNNNHTVHSDSLTPPRHQFTIINYFELQFTNFFYKYTMDTDYSH